jgi:peptidoglycan/LPS O-acetylase OafA/YrhL
LSKERLPVLDGIRGLAILLVMQYHFWGIVPGLFGRGGTSRLDVELGRLFGAGWCGVDLFFVLSGFLITGILYDSRGSRSYFRDFYAKRVLRIFPVYYGFLAVLLFVLPHFPSLAANLQLDELRKVQLFFWTYSTNVFGSLARFSGQVPLVHSQFWSLAVEEQFYLVWPALVLLCDDRRRLMALCAALVAGAFVLRSALVLGAGFEVFDKAAPYNLTPCRIDTLATGGFVALLMRGDRAAVERVRKMAPYVGGAAVAVVLALYVTRDRLFPADGAVATFGFSALALLFGALVLRAVTAAPGTPLYRLLSGRVLRTFGKYSYALYVVHLAVEFQLMMHIGGQCWLRPVASSYVLTNAIFSAMCTLVSFAIAWSSWHLVEKRVLALKRYFEP